MSDINLGPIKDIQPGQGACFIIKDRKIAVFRLRNGSIAGVDNVCPHREGNLCDGVTDENKVICPLHGHKFDLKTGSGSEPYEKIDVYDVYLENGNIMLRGEKNS